MDLLWGKMVLEQTRVALTDMHAVTTAPVSCGDDRSSLTYSQVPCVPKSLRFSGDHRFDAHCASVLLWQPRVQLKTAGQSPFDSSCKELRWCLGKMHAHAMVLEIQFGEDYRRTLQVKKASAFANAF